MKILGPLNPLLPEGLRKRLYGILHKLKKMFPVDKEPETNVPYSLLDSYYNIYLLADHEYQISGSLDFGSYFKLF